MNAFSLIKTKGIYLTWIGYWHEILKIYYLWLAKFLHRGDKAYYGQYGEDLVIDRLTGYRAEGFYVDIGANDPERFSNTKKFYDRGWNGINVDPNPYCYKKLSQHRSRDVNLNIGVGKSKGTLSFFDFEETEVSTFSSDRAKKVEDEGYKLRSKVMVPMTSLTDILSRANVAIDFLSIDAEENNFDVLKSNDWNLYRPQVICIENDGDHDYAKFLKKFGYKQKATTLLNSFFVQNV